MSKIMKRVLSELLLVGMVLSLVGCNEADVLQGELDGLQAKIESQNEKLVELEKENAELSEKVTELETENSNLQEHVAELEKQNPPAGLCGLEKAYENGWLTKAELMSIAYYLNGGRTHNEEIMAED